MINDATLVLFQQTWSDLQNIHGEEQNTSHNRSEREINKDYHKEDNYKPKETRIA